MDWDARDSRQADQWMKVYSKETAGTGTRNRRPHKDWTNDWTSVQTKLTRGWSAGGERQRNTGEGNDVKSQKSRKGADKLGGTLGTGPSWQGWWKADVERMWRSGSGWKKGTKTNKDRKWKVNQWKAENLQNQLKPQTMKVYKCVQNLGWYVELEGSLEVNFA